jgi:hypothetical protein
MWAETWTLRRYEENRLQGFKMWKWRRIEMVRCTNNETNCEALDMVGEERKLQEKSGHGRVGGWE